MRITPEVADPDLPVDEPKRRDPFRRNPPVDEPPPDPVNQPDGVGEPDEPEEDQPGHPVNDPIEEPGRERGKVDEDVVQ
jgi:hypothetical protein